MISESAGSVEAMLRSPGFPAFSAATIDHTRLDRLDPMQNQMCRVCEEPAAGFHFGAFTCEGCKSFFGRTCNNQSVIQECKNNYRCVVDKKNRTACKACRLRKCLMVGMSKSGSRYGRRSNWFKIHCLMQQSLNGNKKGGGGGPQTPSQQPPSLSTEVSPMSSSSLSPTSPPPSLSQPRSSLSSPKVEDRLNKSPEITHSPTMVPRTSSLARSSPFASLLPQPSPASPPVKPIATEASSLASLSPLYAAGFPPAFPLMSTPGFHSLPFHKQALLSPLLAHTHLWQMARANPLLAAGAAVRPELDLMAEHKALMERFAAAAMAAQTAAAAASQTASKEPTTPLLTLTPPPPPPPTKEVVAAASSSPPASPKTGTPEPPQNAPMDLSNKRSDEEDSSEEEMMENSSAALVKVADEKNVLLKKKIRSDLNRNVVHQSASSEEEDEELDVGENPLLSR